MHSFICNGQTDFGSLGVKIDSILVQENVPGCQIIIIDKDSILWEKYYGYANIKAKIKVNQNTIFRIGSITKSFTALAALQLHEDKIWNINDPLKDIVPSTNLKNPYPTPVKLIHLLEHTSGLDDIRLKEYATDCEDCSTSEGLYYYNTGRCCRWEPGKFMSYSNWGTAYLAEALESKTGKEYEEYVKENILHPLNMYNTSFFLTDSIQSKIAIGYSGGKVLETQKYEHILERASGALNTSALELSFFLRMLLNYEKVSGSELLSNEHIKLMELAQTSLSAKQGFTKGYGKGLKYISFQGNDWYGHNGGMNGFRSVMNYNRQSGKGYIVLINKDTGIDKLSRVLMAGLNVPEEIASNSNHSFNERFLGYYNSATSRGQIARFIEFLQPFKRLYKDNEKYLLKDFMGQKTELKIVSSSSLSYKDKFGYEYTYVFSSDGKNQYLQIPMRSENLVQTTFIDAWARILIPFLILFIFLIGFVTSSVLIVKRLFRFNQLFLPILFTNWLSILSFFMMFYFLITGFLTNVVEVLGKPTFVSKAYFVCNIIFISSAFFSILILLLKGNKFKKRNKFYYGILAVGFIITIIYLSVFELNGLKTWEY